MDKPYFQEIFKPDIQEPVFVEGLPGFGNVGKIAAHLLMEFCGEAETFAELYSPYFPDYVSIEKGICRLPRYQFHAATLEDEDLMIMTGDSQPSLDDVVAHYRVCGEILDHAERFGCKFIITIGGVPVSEEKEGVYVAATSPTLAREFVEEGAVMYGKGKILGATGLVLGLAEERGLEGICLLGATSGLKADRGAGFAVFKFLMKILGSEEKDYKRKVGF
ncbi:MAG: PAC2 family protein [Thermoproteota archaeon]